MATLPLVAAAHATQLDQPFRCVACAAEQAGKLPILERGATRLPFDLYRCGDCGLVQQYPRVAPARLADLYRDDYYVFAESEAQRWARGIQQYVVHLASFESQMQSAGKNSRGLRLLDVGCALGHLGVLAKERGWRVTGLDLSADAVSRAVVRFGLDVRAGSLASHVGTLLPFDVILLGDVLEHVADPVRFLADVRKILAPGGTLCIDTPNWGGFWRRWGGSSWLGLNRFHINLFDADCLNRLLSDCGFRDIQATSYTNYRYEGLAHRPELRSWINWLPSLLRTRVSRILDRRRPRTAWSPLRDDPPQEQAAACSLLAGLCGQPLPLSDSLRGDNLAVRCCR